VIFLDVAEPDEAFSQKKSTSQLSGFCTKDWAKKIIKKETNKRSNCF